MKFKEYQNPDQLEESNSPKIHDDKALVVRFDEHNGITFQTNRRVFNQLDLTKDDMKKLLKGKELRDIPHRST